jgi:hypothetical protein
MKRLKAPRRPIGKSDGREEMRGRAERKKGKMDGLSRCGMDIRYDICNDVQHPTRRNVVKNGRLTRSLCRSGMMPISWWLRASTAALG